MKEAFKSIESKSKSSKVVKSSKVWFLPAYATNVNINTQEIISDSMQISQVSLAPRLLVDNY